MIIKPHSLKDLSAIIGCKYSGPENHIISGINEIHMVVPGDLVFVDHPKYYDKALNSAATTILINKEVECPAGKALIFSEDPCRDFNRLTLHFSPVTTQNSPIGSNTKIASTAIIYPNVTIGNNVSIGERTTIYPGAVIYENCVIGNDAIIHANVVIGGHAFYYKKRPEGYDKMHTCGRVVVQDKVEIGAGTTIDRGITGDTVIGEGTKIDNHVHVGHDTVIGKHCLFAAQVGIAGCVVIEDNVTLWGQVGVVSGITIGKGAVVQGQSGVGKTLEGGKIYFGSPCEEGRAKFRELHALKQLPELLEKFNKSRSSANES